jgi:hypothetical protein
MPRRGKRFPHDSLYGILRTLAIGRLSVLHSGVENGLESPCGTKDQ